MKDLKRIFGYLGPYRKDLVFGAFLVVVETSFELVIPVLMAGIIDTGVAGGDVAYILHKGVQMGVRPAGPADGDAVCPLCRAGVLWAGRAHS